jgi:hypothetical protein
MSVSNEYLKTRAVGLVVHLLTEEKYLDLALSVNISEMIEKFDSSMYQEAFSEYYRNDAPFETFVRSTFSVVDKRWRLISKKAESDFKMIIERIQLVVDIQNYYLVYHKLGSLDGKSSDIHEEILSKLIPTGKIPYHMWRELISELTVSSLKSKLLILAPSLAKVVKLASIDPTEKGITKDLKFVEMLNYVADENWKDKHIFDVSPENFIIANLINQIVLRILYRYERLEPESLKLFLRLLKPWQKIPNFIAKDLLFRSFSESSIRMLIDNFTNDLITVFPKLEIKFSKLTKKSNKEILHKLEGYTLLHTAAILKRYSRFKSDIPAQIVHILLMFLIEARNVVWVAFGVIQKLNSQEIMAEIL